MYDVEYPDPPSSSIAEVEAVYPEALIYADTQLAHLGPSFRYVLTTEWQARMNEIENSRSLAWRAPPSRLAAHATRRVVEANGWIHFVNVSAHWHPVAGVWSRGSYGVSSYPRRTGVPYARKDLVSVEEVEAQRTSGPPAYDRLTFDEWKTARKSWAQPLRERMAMSIGTAVHKMVEETLRETRPDTMSTERLDAWSRKFGFERKDAT